MISTVNCTASATELVAANAKRKLLILQNVSDTDMYLKLDASATEVTAANGLKLAVGDPPLVITCRQGDFVNAVRGIHAGSGNKDLRVQEEYFV